MYFKCSLRGSHFLESGIPRRGVSCSIKSIHPAPGTESNRRQRRCRFIAQGAALSRKKYKGWGPSAIFTVLYTQNSVGRTCRLPNLPPVDGPLCSRFFTHASPSPPAHLKLPLDHRAASRLCLIQPQGRTCSARATLCSHS